MRVIATVTLLLALVPGAHGGAPARHLLLVSIDGLRPVFYLDPDSPARHLRALAARGAHARAAEPVFPTVTYPNHASIVTGVRPMRHGIASNNMVDANGVRGRWYEDAAALRELPLWEWVRARGLSTAAVAWPVTVGAPIDLLLPERDYYARRTPLALLQQAVTPGFFERTGVEPTADIFGDVAKWDDFLTRTAAALIRRARPNLLLLHLVQADHFQHHAGPDSAETRQAIARLDAHVATVLAAVDEAGISDRTSVIVVGDHGFEDYTGVVHTNAILARAGLRDCPALGNGWRATAHAAGGSAAIIMRPDAGADAVTAAEAAVRAAAADRYQVLTRSELDALGAMPGAAFGLEAAPGWTFDGGCWRGLTSRRSGGVHGALPSRPGMATGFIAAGAGIRRGVVLDRMRLIDVAPTAARLLGVPVPDVEGRVLHEIITGEPAG
jgi:arylsulfatase A-like enzyme